MIVYITFSETLTTIQIPLIYHVRMDEKFNTFGKSLVEMCCNFDIHILNGRLFKDRKGHITCTSSGGSSVVGYNMACNTRKGRLRGVFSDQPAQSAQADLKRHFTFYVSFLFTSSIL